MLQKAKFKHYIPCFIDGLLEEDANCWLQFCGIMLNELRESGIELFHKIIRSDEASFKHYQAMSTDTTVHIGIQRTTTLLEKQLNEPSVHSFKGAD